MVRGSFFPGRFLACVAVSALLLGGCSSVQVLDTTSRPITLKQLEQRVSVEGLHISFPAGLYLADFKTKIGTYYRATDKLPVTTNGENRSRTGGLYIPSENDPDQRQGAWFDEQDAAPGEYHMRFSAPTQTYRFSQPVPFQRQE